MGVGDFSVVLRFTAVTAYLIVFARWRQPHKNGRLSRWVACMSHVLSFTYADWSANPTDTRLLSAELIARVADTYMYVQDSLQHTVCMISR